MREGEGVGEDGREGKRGQRRGNEREREMVNICQDVRGVKYDQLLSEFAKSILCLTPEKGYRFFFFLLQISLPMVDGLVRLWNTLKACTAVSSCLQWFSPRTQQIPTSCFFWILPLFQEVH